MADDIPILFDDDGEGIPDGLALYDVVIGRDEEGNHHIVIQSGSGMVRIELTWVLGADVADIVHLVYSFPRISTKTVSAVMDGTLKMERPSE